MFKWIEVKNLKWTDTSYTDIDMDVNFSHIGEFVRFTAKANDSEPHGRELHRRAMNGEFGAVSPPPEGS
jgi:hypothetical protein